MSEITTHVLDLSLGRPASGVPVLLEIQEPDTGWKELRRAETDKDGRLRELLSPGSLVEGTYRLTFNTHAYFSSRKIEPLYPQVTIVFSVRDANERYHIPLLLSPFAYSTYRGS
jgi:5-hydroxyisourate hydrolase